MGDGRPEPLQNHRKSQDENFILIKVEVVLYSDRYCNAKAYIGIWDGPTIALKLWGTT
jgi:hypothetical protein